MPKPIPSLSLFPEVNRFYSVYSVLILDSPLSQNKINGFWGSTYYMDGKNVLLSLHICGKRIDLYASTLYILTYGLNSMPITLALIDCFI